MKSSKGHWVTIHGVHVFINDATGRITKGPKSLIGYTKNANAKKHSGRSKSTTKSKSSTSKSVTKTSTTLRGYTTGAFHEVTPVVKPKFYNKDNYKLAFSPAQLDSLFKPLGSSVSNDTPHKGKPQHVFRNKRNYK